jgi:signal peptidase I
MPTDAATPTGHETGFIETLQSLIVAFVLAMTFRGFVTEGFVIPTGSMAPTLMGKHLLVQSKRTGYTFPVGVDQRDGDVVNGEVADPLVGRGCQVRLPPRPRMGDRILVLKSLYPFSEPDRFDVVVFKNPTDPDGPSANYIKRLIGLPSEKIWLADGDVFAAPNTPETSPPDYVIQRKPEHVQRAVWQLIHHSDFIPTRPDELAGYPGPPWVGEGWEIDDRRSYRTPTGEPTMLRWDSRRRPVSDWTSYNSWRPPPGYSRLAVSDLRLGAGIAAEDPAALEMTYRLEARDHVFEYRIADGRATVRMRHHGRPDGWESVESKPLDLPDPGRTFTVEFWHVDQAMYLFVDGDMVAELPYSWSGHERMEFATGLYGWTDGDDLNRRTSGEPVLTWEFQGSPVTLHRVRLDRDLYYRPVRLEERSDNPTPDGFEEIVAGGTAGYGTHPDKPAALGPDQFFMLGDNSAGSSDGRVWRNPHPLIAEQIDPSPFVVNRKLLIGKAWVVYFPAPYSITESGVPFVPDFGRLRYIR